MCSKAFELVNSAENHEKIGGILAIDELIDVQVKENDTKIIRFANFLRAVFPSPTADAESLRLAAKALGAWHCLCAGIVVLCVCPMVPPRALRGLLSALWGASSLYAALPTGCVARGWACSMGHRVHLVLRF